MAEPAQQHRDVHPTPASTYLADVDPRRVFDTLVARWRQETKYSSSVARRVLHPAYQQIIGLGPRAVPWLLDEMRVRPDHWAWALRAITRADPAAETDAGRLDAVARAWIRWGEENGLMPRDRP